MASIGTLYRHFPDPGGRALLRGRPSRFSDEGVEADWGTASRQAEQTRRGCRPGNLWRLLFVSEWLQPVRRASAARKALRST